MRRRDQIVVEIDAAGYARLGYVIVRESEQNLRMFDVPFERGEDCLPHTPSLWVATKHMPRLERAGLQIMTLSTMLTYHLAHVLKAHAAEFIGVQDTLNQMQKNFAELVREMTRQLPSITITDVLQRLVSEEISVRDNANDPRSLGCLGTTREGSDRFDRTRPIGAFAPRHP